MVLLVEVTVDVIGLVAEFSPDPSPLSFPSPELFPELSNIQRNVYNFFKHLIINGSCSFNIYVLPVVASFFAVVVEPFPDPSPELFPELSINQNKDDNIHKSEALKR